jgi:hypothetical protein
MPGVVGYNTRKGKKTARLMPRNQLPAPAPIAAIAFGPTGANDMFDEPTLNEQHETEGAVMSAIPADDSEILSLFREWVAAMRAADALPGGPDGSPEQAEYDAACRRCWNLEEAITAMPAAGAAGFAIKIYIAVHIVDVSARDDNAALSADALDADRCCDVRVSAALLRDAIRFAPELAPLTAAVIETGGYAAPSSLPADVAEHDPVLALITERARLWAECERLSEEVDRLEAAGTNKAAKAVARQCNALARIGALKALIEFHKARGAMRVRLDGKMIDPLILIELPQRADLEKQLEAAIGEAAKPEARS